MANTPDKVIAIALAEEGYCEKSKSAYTANSNVLYDKTAGAGKDNYTKYGKEMHDIYPSVMDFPAYWCDAFVDWCFYKAYGVATAKSLLGGNFDDYTVASAQMYKNKNAYIKRGEGTPKPGDQIFFRNDTRICHTGLVYKVENGAVYTIEGNTSSVNVVVANGGCVAKKSYSLAYNRIDGYGRPKYDFVDSCPYTEPTKDLRYGSVCEGVKWMKWHINKLIDKGLLTSTKLTSTNAYWLSTTSKVFRDFQTKYPETGTNGKPDGILGKKSREKMKSLLS